MNAPAAAYVPRRPPAQERVVVRGLDHRVLAWRDRGPPDAGSPADTPIVLLHGFMDCGATWQFVIDALQLDRILLAPDWRGFGESARAPGGYWFPDYYADLDALLEHVSPDSPVDLIGHSMGGNIALIYAGVRPERVRRVVSLEGFGLSETAAGQAPGRLRQWLQQQRSPDPETVFPDVGTLAGVLRRKNPRLPDDRARFVAEAWSEPLPDGRVRLRFDPAHRQVNPVLYRREEAAACWREVRAPVLCVLGGDSELRRRMSEAADPAVLRAVIPHLESRVIEDAGHMLHHERPEVVAQLLETFLGSTAPAAA